jgi:RNA polymerase sigma-70 factor (ECF subfamily)
VQRDLVVRAQGGEHDAFSVLAGAAIGRLDSAARLILRDADLAQDAVQETLIRCWRDLPTLRDPERFEAWLNRIFLNACRDQQRRVKRRRVEVAMIFSFENPLETRAVIAFSCRSILPCVNR